MSEAAIEQPSGRSLWPLWGVAAGILGYIGHVITMADVSEDERKTGVAVMELLSGDRYHVGVVAGLVAVGCLLVFAAGLRRWASTSAVASLAAITAVFALVASAGAMIIGYGIKGMMAIYLPGGLNENSYPLEALYPLFILDDLLPFIAWNGVAMAAAAVAWLSLRERRLPIWIGIVSALLFLAPFVFLVGTGLSGFPGVVGPIWLIIIGIGLVFTRQAASGVRAFAGNPVSS